MSTDQSSYDVLLPVLEAIPEKEIRSPDMPVEHAVHEGEAMAAALEEDIGTFAAVGLPADTPAQLGAAVGALRIAEAKWQAQWGERKDAVVIWKEKETIGYSLRDEVIAALRYGFRHDPAAKNALRRVEKGYSNADMIQDLGILAELGKKYAPLLEKINFDFAKLDVCTALSAELGEIYAKAVIEERSSMAKILRDKAFTHMRIIMSEIVDAAEYVLRDNPNRLALYYSNYRRRQRNDTSTVDTTDTPQTDTAQQ